MKFVNHIEEFMNLLYDDTEMCLFYDSIHITHHKKDAGKKHDI